jgi:competence protein ComGC
MVWFGLYLLQEEVVVLLFIALLLASTVPHRVRHNRNIQVSVFATLPYVVSFGV